MKKRMDILFHIVTTCGVVLIAAGCSLATPTPTPVVTEPVVVPTAEPISYEPEAGTTVGWVDASYVVFVPGGDFIMGQDEPTSRDHAPAHTVSLDGFWIHQTEVTNRMYAQCVALGICSVPYRETGEPYRYANSAFADAPVVGVDWNQAETYCEWIEGRLPTEAEWEKAARGTEGKPYPWGEAEPACGLLNYDGDCFEPPSPVDVRTYPDGASPYDLADTAGNVLELVYDWYDETYYSTSPSQNPTGPGEGEQHVVRGSSYNSLVDAIPVYLRSSLKPQEHSAEVGFRCVLSGETVDNPPPPACEAPAYVPPEVDTGSVIPHVVTSMEFFPYCLMDEDTLLPHGYVNVIFNKNVTPDMYIANSSSGNVNITQDPSQLDTLVLFGPGIVLDSQFELTVCPALPEPPQSPQEPLCPAGYAFDASSGVCRYVDLAPGEPCPENYVWWEGWGCLYAPSDPVKQSWLGIACSTTPGVELVTLSDDPLIRACVPEDGPHDCGQNQNCSTSRECLPGWTYLPDQNCCTRPPSVEPVCHKGFTYDPTLMMCIPNYLGEQCRSSLIYIPSCEPVQLCQNPGQYGNQTSCEAAQCKWVKPVTGGQQYCTNP